MTYRGQWHGAKYYFGFHYDIHAGKDDTDIGTRCGPRELIPALKLMNPDFVQTDCKGHAGYTSWFSKTPAASVSPGVVKDAMKQWRAATRKLGMPLHCHYSGIWDFAAGAKHPDWSVRKKDGQLAGGAFGPNADKPTGEKMCPRGPYVDELLIPQMKELIDDYGVDGFWVDGDIWAVEPCYCDRCRKAFEEKTGIAEPPSDPSDPHWPAWWDFTREGFEEYVTRYCDAVHRHKPGVLVCSNWLQTFKHPGEPKTPTDWISGDNAWIWGMDGSRCEARFISTRGKPWDIMIWSFYSSHGMGNPDSPWTLKPAQMLMQEAAVIMSFGGSVQIYETTSLRNGQLVDWRMKRLGEVGRFVKRRRTLCQGTETIPQIAVLHSEHHARSKPGTNLMWGIDAAPVQGAVFSLLENHYGVDILDEWALLPRAGEFPVIVAPEQDNMSDAMVASLIRYVRSGGRLLLSGPSAADRFGADFLGVSAGKTEENKTYFVPSAGGATPVFSALWRHLEIRGAKALGTLGATALRDERLLSHPAATLHKVGRGAVACIPFNIFRDFNHNRYPMTGSFIAEVTRALAGRLDIEVAGPRCVDAVFRKKGSRRIVHLINRASGIPNLPNNGAIDEIPPVGPVVVSMKVAAKPKKVALAFEKETPQWKYRGDRQGGTLSVTVPYIHIHCAVVIE